MYLSNTTDISFDNTQLIILIMIEMVLVQLRYIIELINIYKPHVQGMRAKVI